MRQLFYTKYMSGHSGLSNGIMSIEVGVVLAFLTNRFLVLDGNISARPYVVSYGGRVTNDRPCRVTDLIDLPVAWAEPDGTTDLSGGLDLTDLHLWDVVLPFPCSVDVSSADARSFAHTRTKWVPITEELDRVSVLRVSEDPRIPGSEDRRRNLSFYSYLFYFDNETRRSVYRLLQRMGPKKPYAELARRVAADLGAFNAVHLRRGDFKVTYGVTTLDRQPWEAIDVLDHHFRRQDLLVIATDDRGDPFLDEITAAYPHHVFIDHHILDQYASDFFALPQHDSLALAYLSQLIAAESQDFIGSMTSTFTAIIQRYRGNRGRREPFKFLWNELPADGDPLEPGRHPISECVPLDRGIMIEENSGPYSWNRYNPRINPAWMREWPESFLTPEALATGALMDGSATLSATPLNTRADVAPRRRRGAESPSHVYVDFEHLQVAIRVEPIELRARLAQAFSARLADTPGNVIAELGIESLKGGGHRLSRNGHFLAETAGPAELVQAVTLHLVTLYTHARRQHVWLRGAAVARAGQALVVTGTLGSESDFLPDALAAAGWEVLGDGVVPIRVADCMVLPFCGNTAWRGTAAGREAVSLAGIVVAIRRLHTRDALVTLSPSVAVAELIGACQDFSIDRDRAVERLCRLAERRTVGQLFFSGSVRATELLSEFAHNAGRVR